MSNSPSDLPVALGERTDIVDDAIVEVTISFPSIAVPVSEVRGWRRDFVIEIGSRLSEVQLSVQAGGREIAKGYLIARVEDRVGLLLSRTEANGS